MWDPLHLAPIFGKMIIWLFDLTRNYVLAIIIFTAIVKVIMFPFSIKNQKAQASNARLAGRQKQLKEKYKNDKKKLQEEIIKLQSEQAGMSGSCLAMLAPFIVLMALISTVSYPLNNMIEINQDKINLATETMKTIENGQSNSYEQAKIINLCKTNKEKFSMFDEKEMSEIEKIAKGSDFFGLNLLKAPNENFFGSFLWIFPLISVLSSIIVSWFNIRFQKSVSSNQSNSTIGILIPLLVFGAWVSLGYPAILSIYYTISNILEMLQRFILDKFYNIHILNAKTETARILRRLSEEEKIAKIPKRA